MKSIIFYLLIPEKIQLIKYSIHGIILYCMKVFII